MLGHTEILLIVGGVVLLFGASAIPRLFRSIGKAKSEFRKGLAEGEMSDDALTEHTENPEKS